MKLLLDTHTFLWWNEASPRLSKKALVLLSDPANTLLLSVVSAWELVLKTQTGKLRLPESLNVYVPTRMAHYAMHALPVSLAHALASESLPLHHRDPFDRLLIAQATIEGVPIVTADPEFRRYAIKVVW
ncbi:MAG TPA: type II toxin-antitoxin system VapC family toxin [Bryobacteraceae bacterium]|nr:type II toxin-antitoxin system VapC family toxin [Bryobacteraceae bacterium]